MSSGQRTKSARLARIAIVAASALSAVPRSVYADPASVAPSAERAPIPDARRIAEDHFRRGLALADKPGGWEAALAEFVESRRVFPTRSATRNAAIACRMLGRFTESLDLYDALLHEFSGEMSAAERKAYQGERLALLEHFGELTLRVRQAGASIVVDGRKRGTAPVAEPLFVEGGTHVLRIEKEGFQPLDQQVFVAAGSQQTLAVELQPLSGARILAVSEAGGEALDVVVDAAIVGKAPWRGNVSAGLHSVLLRGVGQGTAPVTVDLRTNPSVSITLRAVQVDAHATIEPTPLGATIYIDGELAGSGRWKGALPSGNHRLDVIAPDYLPLRQDLWLAAGTKTILAPKLALNRPAEEVFSGFYLEPNAALLFGRTFRGGVDEACDCDSRSRPFGWSASLRGGYHLLRHFAPELSAGFMRVIERSTRTVRAETVEEGKYGFISHDERDSVDASGPFLALGAGARFFERVPFTAHVSAGAALLGLGFSNAGTFTGYVTDKDTGVVAPASGHLALEEPSARAFVPFVATELRVGYAISRRVSADLGTSLSLYFPPTVTRAGRSGFVSGPDPARIGVLTLPDEVAMRTFLLVAPSVSVRVEL